MCGRSRNSRDLAAATGATAFHDADKYRPSYNVGPMRYQPVLVRPSSKPQDQDDATMTEPSDTSNSNNNARELRAMRWGYVPSWSSPEAPLKLSTINVRGDTLLSTCRSIYSQAKNARRCVVPIDGYYEWQRMPTNGARPLVASRPHHIGYRDGAPLFIAAVFDVCRSKLDPTADPLYSYALVTTEASPSMQFLHERMPVILEGDEVDRWIDNSIPFAAVKHLIRPYTGPRLVAYEVSAFVGKIGNDTDECIKPYTGPPPRETITHYFSKPSSVAPHSPPASQEDHVIDPPDLLLPDDDDDDDDDGHDGHDGEPVEIESGPEALDERALKRKHEEVASGADEEERPEHRQEEAPRKRVHVTAEQEQSILELVGMGFDADKAYDALIRFDFSVERASNYLLDS